MKKAVLYLCLILTTLQGYATTYYNKSSGNASLQTLANWGTNTDGSGTAPSNFTTPGDIFNLYNGSSGTISANWVMTGTTLNIGNGSAFNFTVPTAYSLSGSGVVNAAANATVTISNTTIPALNTLNSASTVVYNSSAAQTLRNVSYGNLTYSGSSILSIASGTYTITGDFVTSGGTISLAGSPIVNVGGSVSLAGTTYNGSTSTLNVTGNFSLTGASLFTAQTTGDLTLNVRGNLTQAGTSAITGPISGDVRINFNNTSSTFASPQIWSNSSSGANSYTYYTVLANCAVKLGTSMAIPNYVFTVNGTLDFQTFVVSGSAFTAAAGSTLYCPNTAGLAGSVTSTTRTWSGAANYVFNSSVAAQVTSTYLPATISSGGSVVINNGSTGVTLTNTTTFASGATLKLQNGTFTNTAANLIMSSGSAMQRDNGTLAATPTTYSGVTVSYLNLGNNALTVTAGNEWPASLSGSVVVNKPSATISLNGAKTLPVLASYGAITITSGTLDVTASNFATTLTGTFSNSGTFNARSGIVYFAGTSAQSIAGSTATTFYGLVANNSAGITMSASATVSNALTLTSGIITTGANTLTANGTVAGASTSNYIKGTLTRPVTAGATTVFDIGDNNYAPAQFTFNTTPSGGTVTVKSTNGAYPVAGSGISGSFYVSHYWTVSASGVTGVSTVTPKFTYNLADIGGGSNTGFGINKYSGGTWLGSVLTGTNTTSPYTTQTASTISSSAFTGDYVVGKGLPVMAAAVGATVDAPFNITFTDDPSWRGAITQVKVGANILPGAAYNTGTAGQITLTPSASAFLQTAGSYVVTVTATGYGDNTVTQVIGAGAPTNLGMSVQPAAPTYNSGPLGTQPVVLIRDQYNNTTTSTATVTANVGAGSWTIGGTTGVAAVAGVATFTDLTATSAALVTGATITFSSGALTSVTSSAFNVPRPPISGTITVPGDYPTLGQAIAAVNASGLSGPVTINCLADQVSPAAGNTTEGSISDAIGAGYVIKVAGAYAPTATNTLTIEGNGKTITATALSAATNYNDAIFTIAGTSYVTINNFKMRDSASNTTNTASNNMTEFGVAIVRGSSTVLGSQNCVVSNCTITLSRGASYTDAIGIYSNSSNSYNVAYTTSTAPTSAAGANSYNSFYSNTIGGATSGIVLVGSSAFNDLGNTVGASSSGNTINLNPTTANMVMATAYANYSRTQQDGIFAINNNGISADYNSITLPTGATTNTANGINIGACVSSAPFTTQITYNTVRLRTAATTQYAGIINASGSASNATLKMNNNTVSIFATSGNVFGIANTGSAVLGNFNNNSINDTTTTATVAYSIYNTGAITTASFDNNTSYNRASSTGYFGGVMLSSTAAITTATIDNNTIFHSCVGLPSGNNYCIYNNAAPITNLSISNNTAQVTHTGTNNTFAVYNTGNIASTLIMNGNTITVASVGYSMLNTGIVGTATFNYNNITLQPTGTAATFGIYQQGTITTADFSYNNISTPNGTTAQIYGIEIFTGTVTNATISYNTLNINCGGTATSFGIYFASPSTSYTADHNTVTMRETGSAAVYGIYHGPANGVNNVVITDNTVDISTTTATTTNVGFIYATPTTGSSAGTINNIQRNILKSASGLTNTSGIVYLIHDANVNPIDSVCFNKTQGVIRKTGSGGTMYGIYNVGVGTVCNQTTHYGNCFSNISLAGATAFIGEVSASSTAQNRVVYQDTFRRITSGTGNISGVTFDYNSSGTSYMQNNYIDSCVTGGSIYGLTFSTYTAPASSSANTLGGTISNNILDSLYTTGASSVIAPIYLGGTNAASAYTVNANTVRNVAATGTTAPSLYGINQVNGLTGNIYNNTIYNFTTSSGAGNAKVYGIAAATTSATGVANIYKNTIYGLSAGNSAGSTSQVNGLFLSSATTGVTYNVYNNFISSLTAPSATNYDAVIGVNMTSTNPTWNLYFNTIYLPALAGGSNFGAAGVLFPSGSSKLTLKNNIINMATSGTITANGIAACLRRNVTGTGGTAPTTANYDGNNNIYYINSGSRNYFYAEQTGGGTVTNGYNLATDANFNACASLYKAYMSSGRESQTSTENNLSAGGTTGTYYPTSSSYAYQSGVAVSSPSITEDYNGVTRSNPPSMGALEFVGSYPSTGAPVITYDALGSISYCIAAPPTLSAAITSGAGINTTPGTKPRLYYKGNLDADALGATNTSSTDGWKYVEASNSSSPFTFTPDYSLLNHTAAAGTTITYFVVAQDNNVTPLVASKTVGYAAGYCPSSVALTSGAFPTVASPVKNTYTITSVPGSFTASVSPTIFCGTSSAGILSLSPSPSDLVLQWQQDYGSGYANIVGATSNNYSATPPSIAGTSATVNYKAGVYCNGSLLTTSSVVSSTEFSPSVTSTTPGSRCGTGSVTLAATGPVNTRLEWFTSPTGGTPVGVGTSLVSPAISSTTIYYVADSFGTYGGASPQTVGQTAPVSAINFTGLVAGAGTGINFTVNKLCTIQSLDIYPANAGYPFTISVYSGTTPVASYSGVTTASAGVTPQTLPVNFYLPPGNYQMCFSSFTGLANSQYGSATSTFPYTTNFNTVTLTSTTYLSYYFFFYNWKVVAPCLSDRTPVTATVNSLPTAGTATGTPATICAGATLTLSQTGSPSGIGTMTSYSWSGPGGYSSSATASSVGSATLAPSASGYYSLTVTYPDAGCTSDPVTTNYVTVNPATTPVITGTLSACANTTRVLNVDVPSGTWSSSNGAVATVDATLGIVYAVAAGSADISYTSPCGVVSSVPFTVNSTPAAITGDADLCINLVTTLSNAVGGGTWTSSNTFVATVNSSTGAVYSGAGAGTTTISYAIGSCVATLVFHVNNNTPSAISGSSTVCVAGVTTLTDATAGGTWSTSNAAIASIGTTGMVTGVANGSATITYSTGCGTDVYQPMTVNGATVALSSNGPICHGSTLSLTATAGVGTYSWTGPNSFSSALQNPSISNAQTTASGTYSFSATVSGCTNSSSIYVVVDSTPSVNVTASPAEFCVGVSSSLSDVVLNPTAFTVYAIPYFLTTLTSPTTINSGSSWTGGNDDGYVNVSLPFTFRLYGVNYTSVNISANGYVNFGTGFSSGGYTPFTLPSSSGSVPKSMIALFWHDMKVTSGNITYGTMGSAPNRKFIINYNAVPDASGGQTNTGQLVLYETSNNIDVMVSNTAASTKVCGVQNSTGTQALTANGQNNTSYAITSTAPHGWRFGTPSYTYAWSPATGLSNTAIYNPVASGLTSSQVYTVTTSDIYSSCSGRTSTASLTVNPVPTIATATASQSDMCSGGALVLTAAAPSGGGGSFVSYVWSGPGGYASTVTSIGTTTTSATPSNTGSYSVVANYSASGCSGTTPAVTSVVNVYPQPSISSVSGSSTTLCAGSALTLSAVVTGGVTGAAETYTWSAPGLATVTSSSSPSPVLTPTLVGASPYQLTFHNDGFGCIDDVDGTFITVNANPTLSLGAVPNICQPLASVPVSYSSTNSPTTYAIDWSPTANANGFVDVSSASLSGGVINLSVPTSGTPGYYTGSITATTSASCVSSTGSLGIRIYAQPQMSITDVNEPCIGYAGSIDFSGTDSATVSYTVDGGATNYFTFSGTTHSLSTGVITAAHTYVIHSASNPVCSNTYDSIRVVDPIPMRWVGGAAGHESEWNYAANWSCGFEPTNGDDVTVDAATYAPVIPGSGSGTTRNLTMLAGSALQVGSGASLNVKGDISNASTISGNGTVVMNGTSAQAITGIGTINNFELNNSAGATINTGSRMMIGKTLYMSAGTLVTNDSLELLSTDTFASARIAELPASGAAISGQVKVDQYIAGGYRRWRFWAHPFSDTISLSQVQKYLDITGVGGAVNGFRTTASNAPSAFRYDPYTTNDTLPYAPGWKEFTRINGTEADSNKLHPGQGIRLFMRGAKGEGLSYLGYYGLYTPSATTIKMIGHVNQGDVNVTLAQGAIPVIQSLNMVGNPYASPIDIGTLMYNAKAAGQISGSAFYVWMPRVAFGGQYMAIPIGVGAPAPYYIQANTSFQVAADHDGAVLNFTEDLKAATVDNYMFKAPSDYITLNIYDADGHVWDRLDLQFNENATAANDKKYDAIKPQLGTDFNFYAIADDGVKMAIDARPYNEEKVIPLGVQSNFSQDFVIRAENIAAPNGGIVTLHDKLLGKYVDMTVGAEYKFTISKDKASQGDARFELSLKPAVNSAKPLAVSLKPNPASDDVKITFTSGTTGVVKVRVMDISGVAIFTQDLGTKQNGVITVPMSNFAAGVYLVEVTQGSQKVTQRLIKE